MSCFSCGESLPKTEYEVLKQYFDIYKKTGKEYYFYKLPGEGLKIITKYGFSKIFETKIKPFLGQGAEYSHIQEFGGD